MSPMIGLPTLVYSDIFAPMGRGVPAGFKTFQEPHTGTCTRVAFTARSS